MPLGSTHDRIILWTLPWVVLVGLVITRSSTLALAVGSGYFFSGLMFSGDLDIYSRQYQRWLMLRWLWLPYRKAIRHRSIWSHGPLIGTLLRVMYLGGWILCFSLAIGFIGSQLKLWQWDPWLWGSQFWAWTQIHSDSVFAVFVGLELGSMNHSLADSIISFWKRWQKRSHQKRR